jgi:beta-glucosidase
VYDARVSAARAVRWIGRASICLALLCFVAAHPSPAPVYLDYTQTPAERARDLVRRMTLDQKVRQMQNNAPAIPELQVPAYNWWNEALHGVARAGRATVFPQAIGLAATWDTDLMFRVADVISTEARAKYHDALQRDSHAQYYGLTFWSPNINIFRDPRWGRGQETYGEDPYLTGRLAVAFIKGMQGDDPAYFKTIATAKHFAVHSGPESTRHSSDVVPSAEDLERTYLPAFRAAIVEGHADSVMCAYNRVNGVPACANTDLLQKRLKQEWGFDGYVVSDCGAIRDIYNATAHHFLPTAGEASAAAVKAGTDLTCGMEYTSLVAAVGAGQIAETDIDAALVRLFTARFKLGMFDPPERVPFARIPMTEVESAAHRALALEAARASIVLLKNDRQTLPLPPSVRSIAVIGPAADDPVALLGNYNGFSARVRHGVPGHRGRVCRQGDGDVCAGRRLRRRPAGAGSLSGAHAAVRSGPRAAGRVLRVRPIRRRAETLTRRAGSARAERARSGGAGRRPSLDRVRRSVFRHAHSAGHR